MSRIYYFKSILKLLSHFNISGVNILNLIANILKYLFIILIIARVIISFVEIPNNKFTNNYYYDQFIVNFEMAFNCFCFVIASISFVFSKISESFPVNIRKWLKISIFLYALSVFVTKIIYVINNNKLFIVWGFLHPTSYGYIYIILFLIYKFFDFHVLLFIVYLLSVNTLEEKQSTSEAYDLQIIV